MSDVQIDMAEVRSLAKALDLKNVAVAAKAAVAVKDAAEETKKLAYNMAP